MFFALIWKYQILIRIGYVDETHSQGLVRNICKFGDGINFKIGGPLDLEVTYDFTNCDLYLEFRESMAYAHPWPVTEISNGKWMNILLAVDPPVRIKFVRIGKQVWVFTHNPCVPGAHCTGGNHVSANDCVLNQYYKTIFAVMELS